VSLFLVASDIPIVNLITAVKGGPGSGYYGHAGRPGERGGSARSSSVPRPANEHIKAVETKLDGAIQRLATRYKTTPSEVEETVAQMAKQLTDPAKPVSIRVSSSVIDKILDSGRFKTQFETMTSGGALNAGLRAKAEALGFGLDEDLAPEDRPVYGYIANKQFDRWLSDYGDLVIELKPEARKRTTVMMGDSLTPMREGQGVPAPVDAPDKGAWDGNITSLYEVAHGHEEWVMTGMEYVEAQIHGGVRVSDIQAVRDTQGSLTATQIGRLTNLGIDVLDAAGKKRG